MGIDDNNTIFLTQEDQELFELQQLKLDSSESFDYKQGYDYTINEIHSLYNLRNKKNNESSTKKTSQTQNKKTVEAPKTKFRQILPRENKKNSNSSQNISSPKNASSPKIVDITDEVSQAKKYSQKYIATKASNSVKTSNLDPKKLQYKHHIMFERQTKNIKKLNLNIQIQKNVIKRYTY